MPQELHSTFLCTVFARLLDESCAKQNLGGTSPARRVWPVAAGGEFVAKAGGACGAAATDGAGVAFRGVLGAPGAKAAEIFNVALAVSWFLRLNIT